MRVVYRRQSLEGVSFIERGVSTDGAYIYINIFKEGWSAGSGYVGITPFLYLIIYAGEMLKRHGTACPKL